VSGAYRKVVERDYSTSGMAARYVALSRELLKMDVVNV
jgi:hypothetical protein